MDNNELLHHGVLGMKWGVRKDRVTTSKKRSVKDSSDVRKDQAIASKKRSVKDLSDEELMARIRRLELEKRYKDLGPKQVSKGKTFVMKVLEKSGQNIATQLVTYAMGKGVNKMFGSFFDDPSIVNPKKGQKDK